MATQAWVLRIERDHETKSSACPQLLWNSLAAGLFASQISCGFRDYKKILIRWFSLYGFVQLFPISLPGRDDSHEKKLSLDWWPVAGALPLGFSFFPQVLPLSFCTTDLLVSALGLICKARCHAVTWSPTWLREPWPTQVAVHPCCVVTGYRDMGLGSAHAGALISLPQSSAMGNSPLPTPTTLWAWHRVPALCRRPWGVKGVLTRRSSPSLLPAATEFTVQASWLPQCTLHPRDGPRSEGRDSQLVLSKNGKAGTIFLILKRQWDVARVLPSDWSNADIQQLCVWDKLARSSNVSFAHL